MRVLVTGGAGYIGSVVGEELIAAGHEVVVFDDLSMGHRAAVHPDAAFVGGTLAEPADVERAFAAGPFDAVMHFASLTLVGESVREPFRYFRENVGWGVNLIEAAVRHGVGRFVLSSTANLFDEPERVPIAETERIVPGSPYGETKAMLERVLHWAERCHGLRSAALRYFNAAGATETRGEDHTPETHLIPIVLEVAAGKREKLTVFGDDYDTPDGTCIRDYIHVRDLASAHIAAVGAIGERSVRYNLGTGTGSSVLEVIKTAEAVTGRPVAYEVGPRRAGDPATLVASSGAIRRELGWEPKRSDLRSIVESAWAWRERNPGGYGD